MTAAEYVATTYAELALMYTSACDLAIANGWDQDADVVDTLNAVGDIVTAAGDMTKHPKNYSEEDFMDELDACKEGKYKKFLKFSGRILERFLKSYILRTQFVHILYLVNGNHSFTLFPFYLINIFITKLLEKTVRKGCFFMLKRMTDF